MVLTVVENAYGTFYVHDVQAKGTNDSEGRAELNPNRKLRSVEVRLLEFETKQDRFHTIKLTFWETEPLGISLLPFPLSLHDLIRQFLVERELQQIEYRDAVLQWLHSHNTSLGVCNPGSLYKLHTNDGEGKQIRLHSHVLTAVCDDVLDVLTRQFRTTQTWLHHLILEKGIRPEELKHFGFQPDKSCATIRLWLMFVRDLMLLPDCMPILQKRVLPGKKGIFSLLSFSVATRNQQITYRNLKRFLQNPDENEAHKQLYVEFIRLITSTEAKAEDMDVDTLWLDKTSQAVKNLWVRYHGQASFTHNHRN